MDDLDDVVQLTICFAVIIIIMIIIIITIIIIKIIIIIMMMMMMIIIIIIYKGAIPDVLQSPHNATPTRTLKWPERNRVPITCNTSNAYHVQHVLCATWYEGTAQLLSLTELKSHLFELYFIG